MEFNSLEREVPFQKGTGANIFVSRADKVSVHWQTEWKRVGSHIAPCMPAIRKVRWLSMEDKVLSGRGEFKPMEIPPVTFEVGSSLRKLGEEVTHWLGSLMNINEMSQTRCQGEPRKRYKLGTDPIFYNFTSTTHFFAPSVNFSTIVNFSSIDLLINWFSSVPQMIFVLFFAIS